MNDDKKVIENMIPFIEEKEREFQTSKLLSSNQKKTDIVGVILKELEKEIAEVDESENQEN